MIKTIGAGGGDGLENSDILSTLLSAVTYFYFNWQYFRLVGEQKQMQALRVRFVIACFAVNYFCFVLFSVLELHLIANWLLFAVLLFGETWLYGGRDKRCALFSTLIGIIWGLSINIFCRSAIAILLHQPLRAFDNNITEVGNVKWIPVVLGFLIAGLAMRLWRRPAYLKRLRLILRYPAHQAFLLEVMTGLFCYLFLNLLLYSTPRNDLLLKLWSIKSCLFCVIGFYIAARYTWRICELADYREKNRQMEQELKARHQEEERLLHSAICDALTGLYNRAYAEEKIADLMERGIGFVLCFVDLDGLKEVNDQHGHSAGDRYLVTVAEKLRLFCRRDADLLFRYGGDEFLAVAAGLSVSAVESRMEALNAALLAERETGGFPFAMSVSYGAVDSRAFSQPGAMIQAADANMYAQKARKKKAR